MKILGIDSSGMVASVAVVEDGILLGEYTTNYKKTHSQTLLPMLDELKKMLDLNLADLDGIAVAAGPGSFTGLRIGAATAKGLGLALNKPLIEVPTLEGLAFNLWGAGDLVCPLIDARRNQVYTGIYSFGREGDDYVLQVVETQCAVEIDVILDKVNQYGEEKGVGVIFLGDGVPVYEKQIAEKVQIPFSYAPASMNRQKASAVASLGSVYFAQGRTVAAEEHQPEYLRKSQAEREREAHGDHN